MNKILLLIIISSSLVSCWDFSKPYSYNPKKVLGYIPVYSQDSTLLRIYSSDEQPVGVAGKIYARGNLIFQNDQGRGLHIIDRSIPSQAKRIGFIHIPGNLEVSLKGNYLYANSYTDLLVIDVTDWKQVKELSRIKDAFAQGSQQTYGFIPLPEHGVYFECTNRYSGIQTGWKKDSVFDYNCYYP